jgi:hypothetical protein
MRRARYALRPEERAMADENAYVAREEPATHADLVLLGDAGFWA